MINHYLIIHPVKIEGLPDFAFGGAGAGGHIYHRAGVAVAGLVGDGIGGPVDVGAVKCPMADEAVREYVGRGFVELARALVVERFNFARGESAVVDADFVDEAGKNKGVRITKLSYSYT